MSGQPLTLAAVVAELARYRVQIVSQPGEYAVNYRGGKEADAFRTEDLAEALAYGRQLAFRPPQKPPAPPVKRLHRKTIIRRHNRKMAAIRSRRAAKEQAKAATEAIRRAEDLQ